MAFPIVYAEERGNKKLLVSQMLHKMIAEISQIIKEDCSVWSISGECLATTSVDIDQIKEDVQTLLNELDDRSMQVTDRTASFVVQNDGEPIYIFVIQVQMPLRCWKHYSRISCSWIFRFPLWMD